MSHKFPRTHRTQTQSDDKSHSTQAQTGDRSPTTHRAQVHTGDQCVAQTTDGLSGKCVNAANNDPTICCTTETIDHPSTAGIQPQLNDQSTILSTDGTNQHHNDKPTMSTGGIQTQHKDQSTLRLKPTPLICQPPLSPPPQPASVGLGNLPSSSGLSSLLTTIHAKLTQSRRPLIEGDILLSELYNPAKFPQLHMLANEPKDPKQPPKQTRIQSPIQSPKQSPKQPPKQSPKDPPKQSPKDPSKEPPKDPNAPKDAKDAKDPKERTSTHSHHKHKTYMDLRAMKKIKPVSKASSRSSSKSSRSSRSSSETSISISGECVGISESSLDNSQSPQSPQSPFSRLSASITSINATSDTSVNKAPVNVVNILPDSKTSVQESGKQSPKKRGLSARLLCCRRRGKSRSPDIASKVNTLRRTTMSNKAILESLDQDEVNDELEFRMGGVSEKKT